MRKRVAVICGGRSSEHEVSCISAGSVFQAIDRNLYEPILIGITKGGRWVLVPESHQMSISGGVLPEVPENGQPVASGANGLSVNGESLNIDLVFPVLHGPFGEDGTIQGFLEIADLPFVGSGVLASAVAMDKTFAKSIFASHSIPVAAGVIVTKAEWESTSSAITVEISKLSYPVFVKPARGGSSRGTIKVKSEAQLAPAIAEALTFDSKIIVEAAIVGKEIECAVLEVDGVAKASVVGEIVLDPRFEFYNFEAKYLADSTSLNVPAPIDAAIAAKIQALAIEAFTSLGCHGLARVDFFLTPQGDVLINEINTMPGFTSTSVFPKLWEASGIAYTQIITELLKCAATRSNSTLA